MRFLEGGRLRRLQGGAVFADRGKQYGSMPTVLFSLDISHCFA